MCSTKTGKMYEIGHAFTYLLLKESVANDVINVSLFVYDKITLKLKMLTKEDKTLIKNVWESKNCTVKRLIKEFTNKKWSKRSVEDFQKRLRTTGPLNEHPVVDVRALLRTLTL